MKSSRFHQDPLCVFRLSPAFSVRAFVRRPESSASRRLSANCGRRRDDWPLSFTRSRHSRFRPCNRRRPSNALSKHLTSGALSCHQKKLLSLQEILTIVQGGWRSSQADAENPRKQEVRKKVTDSSSSDMSSSPVLIRRRLSAPETIMRKHTLAQQQCHSDSQDSEETQLSYKSCQWRGETGAGSDCNLNRRRDADVIRKSTLLRRLWNKSSNSCKFSGTFYEWQHSSGKLSTHSSASVHSSSSPEHLARKNVRKMSPTRQTYDANRNPTSPKRKLSNVDTYSDDTTTFTPRTATTETKCTNTSSYNSNFSDSAYMNSTGSNNNSSEIKKQIREPPDVPNQSGSKLLQSDSTQTQETTDVNVISNVHLSQSTLDLIFNQVIRDVKKSPETTGRQSFYLKRKEDVVTETPEHNRIIKYMISNIGTGSPYSKPAEIPQLVVPRFSALPRTSSMEVNMSSGSEIDDRESDVSLVDSLEDQSPRISLPDNSQKKTKPTAFFIPIQVESDASFKAVSELLPDKVRNRLIKRQVKREEKRKSVSKTDSNYASDSNSNIIDYEVASTPSSKKKKTRSLLPNIDNYRKAKPSDKKEFNKFRANHYKSKDKNENEKKPWVPKTKSKEKLSPLFSGDYAPKRIYRKTEFNNSNKRIEILEIMECLEPPQVKSKIPVSVNQRLPKLSGTPKHTPAFLDLNEAVSDPKLDQLIANILIDTLNTPNQQEADKNLLPKFEMIPEEGSGQTEDVPVCENNNRPDQTGGPYQGKAAVAVVRDENFSSIPKGWITFYMLHNNRGSPDSTSDEGKKLMDNANARNAGEQEQNVQTSENSNKINELTRNDIASINNAFLELVSRKDLLLDDITSSSDKLSQPDLNGRFRKCSSQQQQQQRKQRHRSSMVLDNTKIGKWSVTVSGTNSYGQLAPDLEMCLKFPESQRISSNQSDSGLGDENVEKKFRRQIPRFNSKITKSSTLEKQKENCEEPLLPHGLPDINRNKSIRKRPKDDPGTNPLGHLVPSKSEPRQTRTSSRRYDLSRHKVMEYRTPEIQTSDDINTLFNERQYAEILRRFPEILKVTGNAIRQTKHNV